MQAEGGPNMELRALLAVALSLIVLVVSQYIFTAPPAGDIGSQTEPAPPALTESRGAEVAEGAEPLEGGGTNRADEPLERVAADAEEKVIIETRELRATLSSRGAMISSLILKGYRGNDRGPLEMVLGTFAGAGQLPLALSTPEEPAIASAANQGIYVVSVEGGALRNGVHTVVEGLVTVRLRWADGAGWQVEKTLSFLPEGYLLRLQVKARAPSGTPIYVNFGPGLVEGGDNSRSRYLTIGGVLLRDDDVEHWPASKLEEPQVIDGQLSWAGLESKYFTSLFVGPGAGPLRFSAVPWPAPLQGSEQAPVSQGSSAAPPPPGAAVVLVSLHVPPDGLQTPVYMGPKQYDLLAAHGSQLQKAVDFGFFGFLAYPLLLALKWIHSFIGNYGVAIILLTVFIKIAFLPLTHSSMKSMRKMQQLQPQMAAIRARYKGVKDMQKRQQMNAEVMELYKKHGVSPLGGCLPMLLQMPVLFAFYALLSVAIEIRQAPFALWVTDLSNHDPYYVLPILMGVSMYAQQRMSPTSADPMQARMFRLMPVMFTIFFLGLPSGLVLYWLVNNLLGIAQQLHINRQIEASGATIPAAPARGKEGQKGKGGKRNKRGKR
ncbi:MAG: membrane protein insertase YidC [Acidobacteriota bacterium]